MALLRTIAGDTDRARATTVVIIPAIFSNTPELQADVRRAARSLAADVVNIKFEIGFDVMGFRLYFSISC